jgi:hypothetical protein
MIKIGWRNENLFFSSDTACQGRGIFGQAIQTCSLKQPGDPVDTNFGLSFSGGAQWR